MSSVMPIIRDDGEGERRWFAGGGVFTMKATSVETGGSFLLMEHESTRGKMTPLHMHPHEEETLYVLEGDILVHIEGVKRPLGRLGVLVAPRGVPHAFLVTSDTARLLVLLTPGGGEAFYRDASDPVDGDDCRSRPPDFDRVRAAAHRHGSIEILGPPPFEILA